MKPLQVIAALDSFKGALSSLEAGEAVKKGILRRLPDAEVTVFSVGDGGEGTADALMHALSANVRTVAVQDTHGSLVEATYGLYPASDGTSLCAVFDMSSAASLRYASQHGLDILHSSTYGVGRMVLRALEDGASEIVIGLGGSGTCDGGIGALCAMGARFYNAEGEILSLCTTETLGKVARCDLTPAIRRLGNAKLILLSDTAVPLLGESGAVMLYAKQKGATDEMLPHLDAAMASYASVCDKAAGSALSELPGAGAAGGLGYGLSLIGGKLLPGADYVLDAIGFTKAAEQADRIITGEGKTDRQTATGKLPVIVAEKAAGKPVICLCGMNEAPDALYEKGISAVFALADRPMTMEQSVRDTARLLEKAAFNLAGLF